MNGSSKGGKVGYEESQLTHHWRCTKWNWATMTRNPRHGTVELKDIYLMLARNRATTDVSGKLNKMKQ